MIQVSKLEKRYGKHVILDKVNFSINVGERVGLVGRNGHGKTTLFRIIIGEEHQDYGSVNFPNNYSVGHLSQQINFTEDTVLEEGCLELNPSEDGRDETYKVKTILTGLGFAEKDFTGNPYELSGGYQVRLNLAKVLISEPNLLLLDEPTNYLDIVSIRWLKRFLLGWKNELILITHDRDFMDSVTTHSMAIHRRKIKKIAGSTHKLYQQILQEEEVYEKTRLKDEKKRKEIEQFIARFRAKASKAKSVQSKIKVVEKMGRHGKLSDDKLLDFTFNNMPFLGKCLLKAEDLSFSFNSSDHMLIEGLTISIGKNDRIGIIGKNGKGKTTLLNLFADELISVHGRIDRHTNLKIAYFGQMNIDRLDRQKTVEEEILAVQPEHNRQVARNICGLMMFEGDKALKKINVLSGGERSRVMLGKLLASPANLLLLDEPTNHLDMESVDSLLEAIDAFDNAVMIVTHSEMILHAVATRLIVFDDEKVSVFEGTYQDFLDRVGWKNENYMNPSNAMDQKEQNKQPSKKDLRRARAEIITERSKILGALKKRSEEIERTIVSREKEVDRDTHALLEASQKGHGESIKRLSKSVHESKKIIEEMFNELEILTAEVEKKAIEYKEKLSG
ncbi:MAG: ABC-F family ATP-binding cassette domain-containing protein [Thermodesulfobacteriota bacterium]